MPKTPKKKIQKMLEAMIRQDEEDRKLVTSPKYLEWLVNYTDRFECISETALELYKEQVLPEDRANASKLSALYHIIKCYAEKEGIVEGESHTLHSCELGGRYAFTYTQDGKTKYFMIGHTANVMKYFAAQFSEKEFKAFPETVVIDLNKALADQEE